MNKFAIISVFIIGVILISGCLQQQEIPQPQPNQAQQITKPVTSTEDFISEINELKNSMTEIKEGFHK